MSGRPFLWTRQKAGRLSGWRIRSGSTRLMDAHPILNGSLKDIDVYDCEVSELDAIACDAGLADRGAIGARQVGLVVEAKHIDRNASRVGAQANAVKLSRRPIGVGDGVGAVANARVGHNLAVRVRAIGEPQPASGKFRKDVCVQPSEVSLLGLRLTGEVRLDLLRYIHLAPHASNKLSHAGSDGRRPSIAGDRVDGRQPRTERPSARAACRMIRAGCWVSRLSGADNEAVRSDPGVGDLGVDGGGLFIGVRLSDRLDNQAGGKDPAQPPGEGAARVGDS